MAGSPGDPLDGHTLGADGRLHRVGARVLLVDDAGSSPRLLMVLGHDPDDPARDFWFTPGGGLEHGESARDAAVRELAEETGYQLDTDEIEGPVWIRTALFDFASLPYTQREELYVGWLRDAERHPRAAEAWTAQEADTIDAVQWLTREELANARREVFPAALRHDWDVFLRWDGVTRDMGEVSE